MNLEDYSIEELNSEIKKREEEKLPMNRVASLLRKIEKDNNIIIDSEIKKEFYKIAMQYNQDESE